MKNGIVLLATLLLSAGARAQGCVSDPATDLVLDVSPTVAQPGEPVTVTLTNASAGCTYALPTSCLIFDVHVIDCGGDSVVEFGCLPSVQQLGPGQSLSEVWEQLDLFGQPVPEGSYAMEVTVLDTEEVPLQLCGFLQIGTACGAPPQAYGPAGQGSGGLAPTISSIGDLPFLGNTGFQVAVTSGLGGAPGVMLLGFGETSIPLSFGVLLVDPLLPLFTLPFSLGGTPGGVGQGIGFLPVPIPADPSLLGAKITFQAFFADPGASSGIAHTEGLRVLICQ